MLSGDEVKEMRRTADARGLYGQADISCLVSKAERHVRELRRQISGVATPPQSLPYIWGSIRILSVYGTWSWWKNPKRT